MGSQHDIDEQAPTGFTVVEGRAYECIMLRDESSPEVADAGEAPLAHLHQVGEGGACSLAVAPEPAAHLCQDLFHYRSEVLIYNLHHM